MKSWQNKLLTDAREKYLYNNYCQGFLIKRYCQSKASYIVIFYELGNTYTRNVCGKCMLKIKESMPNIMHYSSKIIIEPINPKLNILK